MQMRAALSRWLLSVVSVAAAACGGGDEPSTNPGAAGQGGTAPSGGSTSRAGAPSSVSGAPAGGRAGTAGAAMAGSHEGGSGSNGVAGGGASGSGGALANGGTPSSDSGGVSGGGGAAPAGGTAGATGGSQAESGGTAASGKGGASGGTAGSATASAGPPEAGPSGYGQGTTGGGAKASQKASSLEEVQALVDAYSGSGGLVIEYTGKFDFETVSDPCVQHTLSAQTLEIKRKSDITLLGADGSSANFGIHIASTSSNIIVRNMTIGLTRGGDASDIVSIEGMSDGAPSKIWIDHNEFFSAMVECEGAGDTEFDGMLDVKKGADAITVSYNYFHDHHKVSLNGSSDSDTAPRHITFHHNLMEKVGSRVPLQRGGYSHIVNNHFVDVSVSGINVRMGGNALVEANYFENVKNPVTSRDSDEIGFWDLRGNNLASESDVAPGNAFGITWDDGDDGTVNATDWKTSKAFPMALGYTYTADPYACVRAGLRAVAGAGKGLKTLECR